MIINKITLDNFKNFENRIFYFDKMNLIKGENGSGKSTLGLESILFALYGYTPKDSLAKLANKKTGKKSYSVSVELTSKGRSYTINRSYPTKVEVFSEGQLLSAEWTNTETQGYINKEFGNLAYFKQFRTVEAHNKDANLLEQGPTALKKTLFSATDVVFNNAKEKLNVIKRDRETWNRDNIQTTPYYPSEIRMETLEISEQEIKQTLADFDNGLRTIQNAQMKSSNEINKYKQQKNTATYQLTKTNNSGSCYACGRSMVPDDLGKLTEELEIQVEDAEIKIDGLGPAYDKLTADLNEQRGKRTTLTSRLNKISILKTKLQNRMSLSNYKYTSKDVLMVKTALDELNKLSTYYLKESVRVLEPIINSILVKIGFTVSFEVNEKNKFAIMLEKDGVQYTYSDLSSGQQLLLQIAFKMSLLLERGETGIVIADEGFSSLDEENLNHVIEIFRGFPIQLFMVLHRNTDNIENITTINL